MFSARPDSEVAKVAGGGRGSRLLKRLVQRRRLTSQATGFPLLPKTGDGEWSHRQKVISRAFPPMTQERRWASNGIPQRTRRPANSANPTVRPRSCEYRAASTSPGKTTRHSKSKPMPDIRPGYFTLLNSSRPPVLRLGKETLWQTGNLPAVVEVVRRRRVAL